MTAAGPTPPESPFRAHARLQALFCQQLGAPFTAALVTLLAERIAPASPLGRRLDGWPGDPTADALVLRLTGGLHAAVLSGRAPALAACYPPNPAPDADALWAAVQPILDAPEFPRWLDSPPQTNEVARSGPLAAGMLVVAAEAGLPLALIELGASAGLNLLPDRYALQLGGTIAGDPGSPLRLAPLWEGPSPPQVPLHIESRIGADLNPLSPLSDAQRLLAYVWPDQAERLARMRTALALAAERPPELVRTDAALFTAQHAKPREGVATLVFHSIAFQYFPPATQAAIVSHMAAAGATASASAPLAWLRLEMSDPANPALPELRLTLWPGGTDRLLGHAHPHGASVRWLG